MGVIMNECFGIKTIAAAFLSCTLVACSSAPRNDAPPWTPVSASLAGFPATVRLLSTDRRWIELQHEAFERMREVPQRGTLNILALSGGGAGGAFGAGALVGMSRRGERPEFQIVTGVSIGALIAPFAFLGPAWDAQLMEAGLGDHGKSLLQSRGIAVLFKPGLFKGEPLAALVDHFVTDDLVAAVAREAARGRKLLIATTDLDKQATVLWDMGEIAAHGGAEARLLFRNVLVASSSIPGVFPPAMIRVEIGGKQYEEMHVDGGATVQFFVMPEILQIHSREIKGMDGANIYVIFNGTMSAPAVTTPLETVPIISRSYAATSKYMSRATLQLTATMAERHNMSLRFSEVPADYPFKGSLDFGKETMQALFEYAAACAMDGRLWTSTQQALEGGDGIPPFSGAQQQRSAALASAHCPGDGPSVRAAD
jgi:predicted acylesterase/phospholipase RssA